MQSSPHTISYLEFSKVQHTDSLDYLKDAREVPFFMGGEYYTAFNTAYPFWTVLLLEKKGVGRVGYIQQNVGAYNVYGSTQLFQARLPLYSVWTCDLLQSLNNDLGSASTGQS